MALTDGMVAGYALGNQASSTTITDFSGSGNHASLVGTASWVSGRAGNVPSFTGTQYIDTGLTTFGTTSLFCDTVQRFAVSAWFSATASGTIIGKAGASEAARQFQVWYDTTGTAVRIRIRGSVTEATTGLSAGWHHIVFNYTNTSTAEFWLDGSMVNNTFAFVIQAAQETTERIIVGARTNGTTFFMNGLLDEVYVWDRALTSTEIGQLYSTNYAPFVSPGKASHLYYRMMA